MNILLIEQTDCVWVRGREKEEKVVPKVKVREWERNVTDCNLKCWKRKKDLFRERKKEMTLSDDKERPIETKHERMREKCHRL